MIFVLSKDELDQARIIEESYQKLITQADERERKLRPEAPPPKDPEDFAKWLESGSQEWRKAREKRLELMKSYNESMTDYINSVYDEHFKRVSGSTESILQSAYEEIDAYIEDAYSKYAKILKTGRDEQGRKIKQFQDRAVRAIEDGESFLLDSEEIIKDLSFVVSRHLEALKKDKKSSKLINDYIIKAVADSQYTTTDEGELFGVVKVLPHTTPLHETTEEGDTLVTRPKDYVTTVDRVTKQLFSNELVKPLDSDPDALYDVRLDAKGKVFARVAIDYKELLSKGNLVELPELNDKDYNVHDAIITLLCAGNRVMSYDMIYRAMTGKVTGKITVPDEAKKTIDESLDKFAGRFKLEYEYVDENGKKMIRSFDEPLVTFQRLKDNEKINGKVVKGGIRLADDVKFEPPLLKWARLNNNEIDTRDITLLDVPRLNNGDESLSIKMCLYRRLIEMRNIFERTKGSRYELVEKQRTIRYDYVYKALGLSDPDANKRRLVKDKIDRCMKHWKDKGLIADYEHKRDKKNGNNFYAILVSFLPKSN